MYSAGQGGVELPQAYKHLVLLVRSVAGLIRVLPAFRPFRNSFRVRSSPSSFGFPPSSSPSIPETRYSFHSSFPSSREFSPSRPTQEFTFDPVTLPFGTLMVSVTFRTDCSVEVCLCLVLSVIDSQRLYRLDWSYRINHECSCHQRLFTQFRLQPTTCTTCLY